MLWADWDALPGLQQAGDNSSGGSEERLTEAAGPEAKGRFADALLLTKHALRASEIRVIRV